MYKWLSLKQKHVQSHQLWCFWQGMSGAALAQTQEGMWLDARFNQDKEGIRKCSKELLMQHVVFEKIKHLWTYLKNRNHFSVDQDVWIYKQHIIAGCKFCRMLLTIVLWNRFYFSFQWINENDGNLTLATAFCCWYMRAFFITALCNLAIGCLTSK